MPLHGKKVGLLFSTLDKRDLCTFVVEREKVLAILSLHMSGLDLESNSDVV